MLEITVNKSTDEFSTYITIIIKQSYEFTLSKDDMEIKIPSLFRPVFSFKFSLCTPLTVYKHQWVILKNALLNKLSYEIVFNHIDSRDCITVDDHALIFNLSVKDFGEIHYRIPITENMSELLTMIDQIADIYPEVPLPEIFQYSLKEFPVFIVILYENNICRIQHFINNYNTEKNIFITIDRANLLLNWLRDRTSQLPDNMTFIDNILNIRYNDGPFKSSSSIKDQDLNKLQIALESKLNKIS